MWWYISSLVNEWEWCIILQSDTGILGKKKSECSYQEHPVPRSDSHWSALLRLNMNIWNIYLNWKPTDTGLLLHYHSHVDRRYKRSLLNTMLNRAFKLSSTWKLFHQECERLKEIFSRLRYPDKLVQFTIRQFIDSKVSEDSRTQQQVPEKQEAPIRIVLPFKDQKSANAVRRQLGDLSRKINVDISPVYTSRKIKDEIKVRDRKTSHPL